MKKFLREHRQLIIVNLVSIVSISLIFASIGALTGRVVNELTIGAVLYGCYLHPRFMAIVSKKVK